MWPQVKKLGAGLPLVVRKDRADSPHLYFPARCSPTRGTGGAAGSESLRHRCQATAPAGRQGNGAEGLRNRCRVHFLAFSVLLFKSDHLMLNCQHSYNWSMPRKPAAFIGLLSPEAGSCRSGERKTSQTIILLHYSSNLGPQTAHKKNLTCSWLHSSIPTSSKSEGYILLCQQ